MRNICKLGNSLATTYSSLRWGFHFSRLSEQRGWLTANLQSWIYASTPLALNSLLNILREDSVGNRSECKCFAESDRAGWEWWCYEVGSISVRWFLFLFLKTFYFTVLQINPAFLLLLTILLHISSITIYYIPQIMCPRLRPSQCSFLTASCTYHNLMACISCPREFVSSSRGPFSKVSLLAESVPPCRTTFYLKIFLETVRPSRADLSIFGYQCCQWLWLWCFDALFFSSVKQLV